MKNKIDSNSALELAKATGMFVNAYSRKHKQTLTQIHSHMRIPNMRIELFASNGKDEKLCVIFMADSHTVSSNTIKVPSECSSIIGLKRGRKTSEILLKTKENKTISIEI